jgi:hypothetical protein
MTGPTTERRLFIGRGERGAGGDLAMIVAPPGSDSQRNAERAGFRLACARKKWRL